jgi:hypothetical protein
MRQKQPALEPYILRIPKARMPKTVLELVELILWADRQPKTR